MAAPVVVDLLSSPEPEIQRAPRKIPEMKQKSLFIDSDSDEDVRAQPAPISRAGAPERSNVFSVETSPRKRRSPANEESKGKRLKSPVTIDLDEGIGTATNRKENTPPKRSPPRQNIIRLSESPLRGTLGTTTNQPRQKATEKTSLFDDSDDDLPDVLTLLNKKPLPYGQSKPHQNSTKEKSRVSTSGTLASLNVDGNTSSQGFSLSQEKAKRKPPSIDDAVNKPSASSSRGAALREPIEIRDRSESVVPSSQSKTRRPKLTEAEKEKKAEEKAREKARKEEEKLREKARKEAEKEIKAREKAEANALRDANKNRTKSSDETMPEMIVDIAPSYTHEPGYYHLEQFLPKQKCKYTTDRIPRASVQVGHVITWRRKATTKWDEEKQMHLPIEEEIRRERHILAVMTAVEYLELTKCGKHGGLEAYVKRLRESHPEGGKPIFLIEGMLPLTNKMRNKEQREWRNQALGEQPSSSTQRKSKDEKKERERIIMQQVTPDEAEDALLELQFLPGGNVLMHQTNTPMDTAEWIITFTREVARGYYKAIDLAAEHTGFERTNRCGNGHDDTFHKMLQEITRVTPSIANGIMNRASNVKELIALCKKDGKDFAADIKNMATRSGVSSSGGRRIGPACSARIYTVFTERDSTVENV